MKRIKGIVPELVLTVALVVGTVVVLTGVLIGTTYKPEVAKQTLVCMKDDILDGDHTMVYPNSRLASKIYIAMNAWQNRWRYDAFYEGGFWRFIVDSVFKLA